MVLPYLNQDVWCYWVISVGALISFIGLIIACICSCRHSDHKSEFLGLAGMVTITHPDSILFNRMSPTDETQTTEPDPAEKEEKRSKTANRSLPDIPKDKNPECNVGAVTQDVVYEVTETVGEDPLELYATVQEKAEQRSANMLQDNSLEQNFQDDISNHYARLKTPQNSTEEHPYAQLQNTQKCDAGQRVVSEILPDRSMPSTSSNQLSTSNPVAPPRSRRSSNNSVLEHPVPEIQAAIAISGGIPANQELPYMTPPIVMPAAHPSQDNRQQQQHFSGDSQDSKGYTSISVREPLANIIAQTNNSRPLNRTGRALTDPHYATVSDDSDEMYAAIDEQEKVYTSGSDTYAQIQPPVSEIMRTSQIEPLNLHNHSLRVEEPNVPQPPSVDSLRHVAHAHSRQASTSSASSSVVNPSSPKPEKRQANSPLPPPPEKVTDVYATVDKRPKSEDASRSSLAAGKSLEDMYAKVIKKKRDGDDLQGESSSVLFGEISRRKRNLAEVNRASWSHESIRSKKRDTDPCDIDLIFTDDCGSIFFPEVESPESDSRSDFSHGSDVTPRHSSSLQGKTRNGIDPLPIQRQYSRMSSDDPGYEKVIPGKGIQSNDDAFFEPNYERIGQDINEPNYASVCRPGGSDTDPNYESVNNSDPNYESVKYMSAGSRIQDIDPPYEQVNCKFHGYARVKAEPDYEKSVAPKAPIANSSEIDDDEFVQV